MPPPEQRRFASRRLLMVFASGGALVCLLAVLVMRRDAESPKRSGPEAQASPAARVKTREPLASPFVSLAAAPPTEAPAVAPALAPTPTRLERALEDFKRQALYPPESRPFDEGSRYKLNWNAPLEDDLPFETFDDAGVEGDLYYRLLADRSHCAPGEALTTTLQVYRGGPDGRLPVRFHAAAVVAVGRAPSVLAPLEFRDDGVAPDLAAGDFIYTHRFVPSELPALVRAEAEGTREVALELEVEAASRRLKMRRAFTYAATEPLRLLSVRDARLSGSLAVTLAFEVTLPGLYTFEANLLSPDGKTPLGWVHQSQTLRSGTNEVTLTFFGKILHDAKVDGPYLVSGLRGFLRTAQGAPLRWWVSRETHLTGFHRAASFSPEEWTSPEKEARRRMLERLIEASKTQELPPSTTSPHIHIDEDGVARPATSPR